MVGFPTWAVIERQMNEWQPNWRVVVLPTDLYGKELETIPPRAKKFANRLHGRFGLPVELHDERLSTMEARADLFEMGGYKALSKGNIDCQSAVVILESWFEAQWGE